MATRGCGCKTPTNQRVTEDGIIEQSFDNGVTWERVTDDPRFNAPVFPPLVGDPGPDLRCAGALSGREVTRLFVEQVATATDIFTEVAKVLSVIIGFLVAFLGPVAAPVVAIIAALALFLMVVGQAAFAAAMTPATLDTLKCILYCRIDGNAAFSESSWQAVKEDILAQFAGIPESVYWNYVNSLGPVGLTNICRALPGLAGDCDLCACDCDEPIIGSIGTGLLSRPDLGIGWWQVTTVDGENPLDNPNGRFYADILIPACCLHNAYTYDLGLINAPPGNRAAWNCETVPGFANYGLGGCQERILFRAFNAGNITFQILECP